MTSSRTQRWQAQCITIVTAIADAFLGCLKITVGSVTHSGALIADGIHSLADLLTDLMVMVATHFGRQAPDKQHPYGHGRIETMASLGLGMLLIAVAAIMGWNSVQALFLTQHTAIGTGALIATVLALVIKEAIYHWTMRIARAQRSPLLEASAWHSRSDSLSSLIVLIGLIGSLFGLRWLDPLAAIIVSILVGHIGTKTLWHSSRELIDTTLSDEVMASIRQSALSVPELRDLHDLRARHVGSSVCLDVHLLVNDRVSATEAHEIGNAVVRAIRQDHPQVLDITFHIDIEDDRFDSHAARHLPLRHDIERALDAAWHEFAWWQSRRALCLHYEAHHTGKARSIDLTVTLPHDTPFTEDDLYAARARIDSLTWCGQINVWREAIPSRDQG